MGHYSLMDKERVPEASGAANAQRLINKETGTEPQKMGCRKKGVVGNNGQKFNSFCSKLLGY